MRNMNIERPLEMQYKGDRNYLHGTDIFNETLSWLISQKRQIKDIDFAFHRLASHQLKAVVGSAPEEGEPVAVCTYTSGSVRERVYLTETDRPITGRYPYPEDEIVNMMEVDLATRRGVLRADTSYSDIETWVAMTKSLHYKAFPQLNGRWLFVRGRFPQYIRRSMSHERVLVIASEFNNRLTRSDALQDGVKVGEIYFSIV